MLAIRPNDNYYHLHQIHRVNFMYVCICKGITDKDIEDAVMNKGVGTMRELKQHVDLGSDCGSCTKIAQSIIDNFIVDESLFKDVG